MTDDRSAHLLAADAIKHLNNKNYGLAQLVLLELWSMLVSEHREKEARKKEKGENEEPE